MQLDSTVGEARNPVPRVGLTQQEAAESLGVSQPTIERLIADRELESFKIGRRRLISPEALRRYVLRREAIAREVGT
jgi:excisionase family DNA binding protein